MHVLPKKRRHNNTKSILIKKGRYSLAAMYPSTQNLPGPSWSQLPRRHEPNGLGSCPREKTLYSTRVCRALQSLVIPIDHQNTNNAKGNNALHRPP